MNYKIIASLLLAIVSGNVILAKTAIDTLLFENVSWSTVPIVDFKYVRHCGWDNLFPVLEHPAVDSLLDMDRRISILNEINHRKSVIGDTLRTADLFYIWKPYFEWLHYVDPHYNVEPVLPLPVPYTGKENDLKYLSDVSRKQQQELAESALILPVNALCINDTLVVVASNVPEISKGDAILSVNGISVAELLEYDIAGRYKRLNRLLLNYYYHGFDKSYAVQLLRNDEFVTVEVAGRDGIYIHERELMKKQNAPEIGYFESSRAGYVRIASFFPDNTRVIRHLRKHIKDFRNKGYRSVIVDLRNNPGGTGADFDKLLSIFIDEPEIQYQKNMRLRVSKGTVGDYDFITEDMIGMTVNIPERYLYYNKVRLNPKKYIGDMRYYILMDEGTASAAAFLCELLQYYGGALLVGEPLLHNASKYGEVLDGRPFYNPTNQYFLGWLKETAISTTESELVTKAVDGVLMPDIHIPYVAKDYMTGKDAMLDKLLEIIRSDK